MESCLLVNRTELLMLLKTVGKFGTTAKTAKAALTFDGTNLVVRLPGMEQCAAACGTWRGQAIIPVQALIGLSEAPLPDGDTVTFEADGQGLRIGPLRIPAVWESEARPLIQIPLDAPLWILLGLPFRHSEEEIERAGLTNKVAEAARQRDALLSEAYTILQELGIPKRKLVEFVEGYIRSLDQAPGIPAS